MVSDQAKHNSVRPVWIALAIAILGILAMLIVDHGPWARRRVHTAQLATNHQTTEQSAQSAGAGVTPTKPRDEVEPDPSLPQQVEPANPAQK
jgi:hypothetical protein